MFRPTLALLLLLLPLCPWAPAFSDDSTVVVPPGTKLAIQVDIATFGGTALGKKLLQLTRTMASEEIGEGADDVDENVKMALGFDPLTEIQSILVMSSSFEELESGLHVIVKLGKTTGNLEGLMLALPEHKTVEHGEHTIHSAADEDIEGFVAIHTDEEQSKWILGSSDIESVRVMLDGFGSHVDATDAPTPGDSATRRWRIHKDPSIGFSS